MDEGNPDTEWRSVLIDLSAAELAELVDRDDDSALARCLRRLEAELAEPGEPVAGFNSAL